MFYHFINVVISFLYCTFNQKLSLIYSALCIDVIPYMVALLH